MAGMVVEYDTEIGAFYVRVTDSDVARTVEVSSFMSVDLDGQDNVVGLELLRTPAAVTAAERATLERQFPVALAALKEVERLIRPSA